MMGHDLGVSKQEVGNLTVEIQYRVWDEITYPFQNLNGAAIEVWERLSNFIPQCTVEVWEWLSNFIPHFTGHYNYVSMLSQKLKLIHISKRASWD